MDRQHRDKSSSFTSRIRHKGSDIFSPRTHSASSPAVIQKQEIIMEEKDHINHHEILSSQDHDQVSRDIDQLTDALSAVDDKSTTPDVPDTVETFTKIIESKLAKYHAGEFGNRFGKMTEEDNYFIEAVRRISKLTNAFGQFPKTDSLDRTRTVLQRAMVFLEEELRALLEDSKRCGSITKVTSLVTTQHTSFNFDRCVVREPEQTGGEGDFPGYSPVLVTRMSKIAATMVFAGYETECCQVYSMARGHGLSEQLKKVEFEKLNIEDVQKMQWDSLEGEVIRWIRIMKQCSSVLFPGERKLTDAVFSEYPNIARSLFSNLARNVIIPLLDFAGAVAMTKRSAPEKVFKFLDMYEALRDLAKSIGEMDAEDRDREHEMFSGINAVKDRIGEAVVNIFNDFENSIKNDVAKTPVPGGAIHPLTRYVMNYLEYTCGEYKDTLEHIFNQHAKINNDDLDSNSSPFAAHVLTVMDLLDSNLEAKSSLYKDPALRNIFLMNNGRYILQKAKKSKEIHQVMGDTWCRRKSTVVRAFHKTYQRDTWGKLLQTITHDGLLVNGKVDKKTLKERFKNFNNMFEEIHKSQSHWVVSDEQLLSELRVSISAVVIPAYRSFLGRFKQHLEGGRSAEKYMKYQPEDIETMIEELFDGNPVSMNKRKS